MTIYEDLVEKHGTLEEFVSAVESAFNDGFCSWEEKENAINEYAIELSDAEKREHSTEQAHYNGEDMIGMSKEDMLKQDNEHLSTEGN